MRIGRVWLLVPVDASVLRWIGFCWAPKKLVVKGVHMIPIDEIVSSGFGWSGLPPFQSDWPGTHRPGTETWHQRMMLCEIEMYIFVKGIQSRFNLLSNPTPVTGD